MKTRIFIASVLTFLTALVASPATQAQSPVTPPTTLSALNGETLWMDNCAPCHGSSGKGDGATATSMDFVATDFTDPAAARNRNLADMFTIAKEGRMDEMMPPWADKLSDEQIWDVVAYAASLGVADADIAAGKAIYAQTCIKCHGEDGSAGKYDFSDATALINFSDQDLFNELRTPEGKHPKNLDELSDDEIWQALAYIRTLSVAMPASTSAPADGVFRGQVLNATTGETVAGIPLTLYILDESGNVVDTVERVSNADGTFEFSNLKRDAAYGLGGEYLGIRYFTDEPAFFSPDSAETEQTLSVYETTESAENISQSTLHRIVAFVPDAINITDIYIFDNTGDTSYVGTMGADGLPETVKIALPADATEVSFQNDSARQTDDGYYTESRPIIPGEEMYSFVVSYFLPFDGKSLEVVTPLIHDVKTVNMLLADQGETLTTDQLKLAGEQGIQGLTYQQWEGGNLTAGQDLTMSFGKLNKLNFGHENGSTPTSNFAASGPDQLTVRWAILGVGVLLIAFVLWMVYRPVAATAPATSARKEELLAVLQSLDSMHAAGDLTDEEYHRLRAQNVAVLKAILSEYND